MPRYKNLRCMVGTNRLSRRVRVCMALVLLGAGVCPSTATALDLAGAWSMALQNDPELAAARADLQASDARVLQTRSSLLPQAELTASTSDNKRVIQGSSSEGFNNHDWGASLTQPVFNVADWYNLQASRAGHAQARAEFSARVQALMVTTATEYFDVLRAIDDLSSAGAAEQAFASQLEQARERFDVGLVAMTEVHEAQAVHDAARVDRIIQDGIIDIRREILESRIGQPFERVAALADDFPLELPEPMDREAWIRVALEHNQQLQAVRESVSSADLTLNARRAEHLPDIDFFATYRHNVQGGANFLGGKIDNRVLGLRFTLPISSGGLTSARVREAQALQLSAAEQVRAAERDVRENIRVVHRQVASDVLRIQALAQSVVSARSALEATETGYEVGTRNAVEVLQSRQAMHQAERDHANARYDYVVNLLRLKEAAGTLNPEDILALNRWLR